MFPSLVRYFTRKMLAPLIKGIRERIVGELLFSSAEIRFVILGRNLYAFID